MNRDPRVDPQPGDETTDGANVWKVTCGVGEHERLLADVYKDGKLVNAAVPINIWNWRRNSVSDTVLHVAGEPDSPLVSRSDKAAHQCEQPDEPPMTFDAYQAETRKTAIYGTACDKLAEPEMPANKMLRLSYVSLGLGEAGEIQGKVKKLIRDRNGELTTDDRIAIAKELGDLLFYVSATADEIGITLEEIASMNVEKLQDRKSRGVLGGSGDNR